jgi:hypothetical protein
MMKQGHKKNLPRRMGLTTQPATRQAQKIKIVELLPNLGWLTKCDREKQHADRQCQNQNISNAFHGGFFLKKMVVV